MEWASRKASGTRQRLSWGLKSVKGESSTRVEGTTTARENGWLKPLSYQRSSECCKNKGVTRFRRAFRAMLRGVWARFHRQWEA